MNRENKRKCMKKDTIKHIVVKTVLFARYVGVHL